MKEDQERLLHSRSPGARNSALFPSDSRSFVFIRGSLSAVGFTDFGPPLEFDEERFHVLQRRALRVTEAKPLINANARQ